MIFTRSRIKFFKSLIPVCKIMSWLLTSNGYKPWLNFSFELKKTVDNAHASRTLIKIAISNSKNKYKHANYVLKTNFID